ncbi:hypothetical protein [Caulobacter sp. NIBR1757]|uniref:hypothetical protein n=1 Tax=Caulobacter sp. NIBR1757 TaxID=3016000 RepID=UPI0022F0356F|nr:hypothetical protein [Caulobacter sp. NIBR1757]WGM37671.1 hypothetical protein AMEJIAPC_00570 [Caulobacter sp. NIBR1757]
MADSSNTDDIDALAKDLDAYFRERILETIVGGAGAAIEVSLQKYEENSRAQFDGLAETQALQAEGVQTSLSGLRSDVLGIKLVIEDAMAAAAAADGRREDQLNELGRSIAPLATDASRAANDMAEVKAAQSALSASVTTLATRLEDALGELRAASETAARAQQAVAGERNKLLDELSKISTAIAALKVSVHALEKPEDAGRVFTADPVAVAESAGPAPEVFIAETPIRPDDQDGDSAEEPPENEVEADVDGKSEGQADPQPQGQNENPEGEKRNAASVSIPLKIKALFEHYVKGPRTREAVINLGKLAFLGAVLAGLFLLTAPRTAGKRQESAAPAAAAPVAIAEKPVDRGWKAIREDSLLVGICQSAAPCATFNEAWEKATSQSPSKDYAILRKALNQLREDRAECDYALVGPSAPYQADVKAALAAAAVCLKEQDKLRTAEPPTDVELRLVTEVILGALEAKPEAAVDGQGAAAAGGGGAAEAGLRQEPLK